MKTTRHIQCRDEDELTCNACAGSGEGYHEGATCSICKGSGVVLSERAQQEAEDAEADRKYEEWRERQMENMA